MQYAIMVIIFVFKASKWQLSFNALDLSYCMLSLSDGVKDRLSAYSSDGKNKYFTGGT